MEDFRDHALAALTALEGDPRLTGVDFVIEQRVGSEPDWESHYHVIIREGEVRVVDGGADEPNVTITLDAETARALRAGDLHAQSAFLTGRLGVDGDIPKLIEHGELFGQLVAGLA